MKRLFTSDLHFGHRNVLTYCNRPYKDLDEMHAAIISIWNSQVDDKDEVYVLGDFSLNPKWSREITRQLKGVKHLIAGNHDACWPHRNPKADKMRDRYLGDGWASIDAELKIVINGQTVRLSHLPYWEASQQYDNRYVDFRPKNDGLALLHGHLHKKYQKLNNMIDVGFDGDLKLYTEEDIITLLNDPRDFIPSPLTEFYKERGPTKYQAT